MKRILITLMIGMTLTTAVPSMARHNSRTVTNRITASRNAADKNAKKDSATAIVAFSDTTDNNSEADEDSMLTTVNVPTDSQMKMLQGIMGDAMLPVAIVFIMFFLAPVAIIALIIYFIIKSRNQKIKMAEIAMKNGQQIPNSITRQNTPANQYLWAKGMKKIFLGIALAVMFLIMGFDSLWGIGIFIAIIGAGQCVIAKTTKSNTQDGYVQNDFYGGSAGNGMQQEETGQQPEQRDEATNAEYADDIKD